MNETQDSHADSELHALFRSFLLGRDPTPLVRYAAAHPSSSALCDHEYPAVHRLCDFQAGSQAFRVSRCSVCGERLFILPLSISPSSDSGVPYELSGAALACWVSRETEHPAKAPQDWSHYLNEFDRNA